jgi:hypothetical protein
MLNRITISEETIAAITSSPMAMIRRHGQRRFERE